MQRLIINTLLLLSALVYTDQTVVAGSPGAGRTPLEDPSLTEFVRTVVNTNPRVQAARAAVAASGAHRSAAARPLYNPALILDVENSDTDTRTVGLSQAIDWGGKRLSRTAVAESDRLAMEAEYQAVRGAVATELLSGLARHQGAMEHQGLAEKRVRLMNEFATLARRRLDAGDLNSVESDLAALAALDARMSKAEAGADLAEARQAVRRLTPDTPPAQWPVLPLDLPELSSNANDAQSLVLALPQVRAARRRVDAANATVVLRERERRPDPTISLVGGREDDQTLIGFNLSIPLFVRNRFDDEVRVAVARRSEAQQLSDDIVRRATARLASVTERYQLARAAWRDWERIGRASLGSPAKQLRRLWELGEIGTTAYLVGVRQTLDIQQSAIDLRLTLWRAWFEWLSASGEVNAWIGPGTIR